MQRYRGLGHDLEGATTLAQIRKKSKLDWTVSEMPASVSRLKKMFPGATVDTLGIPGFKVLLRPDETHPTGVRALDIVTEGYKVVQNDEILAQFTEFAKLGEVNLEVAGASDDGRRIFAVGRMKGEFKFKGVSDRNRIDHPIPGKEMTDIDDTTYMKILMGSGHIRGVPLSFDVLAEREICINGFVVSEHAGRFRMPHRSQFDERQQAKVHSFIEGATIAFKNYEENARIIHKTKTDKLINEAFVVELIQPELFEPIIEKILSKRKGPFGEHELGWLAFDEIVEKNKPLKEEDFNLKVRQILHCINEQPGAEFGKGTLWNTLNAVTYYIDHMYGRSNDTGFEYAMFGDGSKIKTAALSLALQYVRRLK